MSTKSMAYDHPAYLARLQQNFGANTAGASAAYAKFAAFTAMHVYSIGLTCVTAGTSTHTGWNGTATVTTTGTGATITAFKVSGTTTSTYGPYVTDAAAGGFRRIQVDHTGVGSSTADGGVSIAQGDLWYHQLGTDATSVQVSNMEYSLDPGATVSN